MPMSIIIHKMHSFDCPSNYGDPCEPAVCDFEDSACDDCGAFGPVSHEGKDGRKLCDWCEWENLTREEARRTDA